MTLNYTLDVGAYAPIKAHKKDAGYDLRTPTDIVIPALTIIASSEGKIHRTENSCIVDTGVHVEIPEGYVGMLKSKSGLNVKHSILSEGVIDAGYTGSVVVKLYNHGVADVVLPAGSKITQLVVLPIMDETELYEKDDNRLANGFGSTGK